MWTKRLGQCAGFILGSCLSPSAMLVTLALKPYMDLHVLCTQPERLFPEMMHAMTMVQQNPYTVLFNLVPLLIIILVMNMLYLAILTQLGGHGATFLRKQMALRWALQPRIQ